MIYQLRQLQYLAVILFLAVLHLCLARKLLRLAGLFFLILTPLWPNLIVLMLPVLGFRTYTLNFFGPLGVLIGLLRGFFVAICNYLPPLYAK